MKTEIENFQSGFPECLESGPVHVGELIISGHGILHENSDFSAFLHGGDLQECRVRQGQIKKKDAIYCVNRTEFSSTEALKFTQTDHQSHFQSQSSAESFVGTSVRGHSWSLLVPHR